jgi:MoaA/NifB/PqqE/SkfB family radical SAM enzyme
MVFDEPLKIIRKTRGLRRYPTAGRNASFFGLVRQGIPYYLDRDGTAYPPLSVFIHVNSTCNLKCYFCDVGIGDEDSMFFQNVKGKQQGDMPIEKFKALIDEVKAFRPLVSLPATEPLFYPHIVEAVKYITEAGLHSVIATNGTLLEKHAADLIAAGLTKPVISLDGPPAVHDKIRGIPGTFDRVMAGVERLVEEKKKASSDTPLIFANYVITQDNHDCLVDFLENINLDYFAQIDFRVMFYCTEEVAEFHNQQFGDKYDATSACLGGGVDLSVIDGKILAAQVEEVKTRFGDKCKFFFKPEAGWLDKYYHEPMEFMDNTRCVFPWFTAQISQSGDMIPPQRCYHQIFGNVFRDGFMACWNGEKMRAFRRDLQKYRRFPACTRCEGVNY